MSDCPPDAGQPKNLSDPESVLATHAKSSHLDSSGVLLLGLPNLVVFGNCVWLSGVPSDLHADTIVAQLRTCAIFTRHLPE